MSKSAVNKKDKKIKKLRKAHVWPSVAFFFIAQFLGFVACAAFVSITLVSVVETRIEDVGISAISTVLTLDAAEGREQAALDTIYSIPNPTSDALYVMGADGSVIASHGERTFTTPLKFSLITESLPNGVTAVYADESTLGGIINDEGEIDLTTLLDPENSFVINLMGKLHHGEELLRVDFWILSELSGGRTAMVKCSAPVIFDDVQKSLIVGLVVLGVMLLLLIFFLTNILLNVHSHRRMTKLLYTDTTTGGNSFMYFDQEANKAIAGRGARSLLMIVDITLTKFASYCNYHGAHAGDELLTEVDSCIVSQIGKKECCAHTGHASFALLLDCTDRQSGTARVEALVDELDRHFSHCGTGFHAGIYFSEPGPGRIFDSADCFGRAGAARRTLSDESTQGVVVYNDAIIEEQRWEHHVEESMQRALDDEEFQVYIQPKYDPVTEKIAGAEALVRWINEQDGFVPPGRFIPIFEKNGFVTKLDDYMISHVAKLQAAWLGEGKEIVPISVNVSRAHFADPDLANHICRLVDRYGVPHKYIEIELTESAFFDNKSVLLKIVNELNDLGFDVSMDDFGAGYSSLNSLKDLPLDVLKLDAEFFRGEDEADRGKIVVTEAINLAKKLNMRIVAEGIEKKEQVDFLAESGCDMIQGYYFAKPMPADEYAKSL